MARRTLPGPIFHYVDGAADHEVTYRRNTEAYERCDLVPNVPFRTPIESGTSNLE
jgi:L-lactate dehydrogenase (cytochrome)